MTKPRTTSAMAEVADSTGDATMVRAALEAGVAYPDLKVRCPLCPNASVLGREIAAHLDAHAADAGPTEETSVADEPDAREHDPVNHPKHYNSHPSGVECITVVEHMGFNCGNAIKYIWRADLKGNALEDLEKARWYIDREIQRRTKGPRPA